MKWDFGKYYNVSKNELHYMYHKYLFLIYISLNKLFVSISMYVRIEQNRKHVYIN